MQSINNEKNVRDEMRAKVLGFHWSAHVTQTDRLMVQVNGSSRPGRSPPPRMGAVSRRRLDSGFFGGNRALPTGEGVARFNLEGEGLAALVEGAELAVHDRQLACMLDADLPVGRFGNAAETAPVNDKPLIDARRARSLDFLGSDAVRLDEPVDILGAKALGVIDVKLSTLLALGILPVDFLAAGLDDVQVKIGVGIPDQCELRVAHLDGDPANELASLAEAGQAEAIALTGAGIVVGDAATSRLACRREPG